MKTDLTQKRISLFISVIGIIVVFYNFITYTLFREMTLIETLIAPSVIIVFLFSLLLFVTRNLKSNAIQVIHIIVFLMNSAIAIIDDYESFNGIGFAILAIALSYKYGYLNRHKKLKLMAFGVYVIFFIELSVILSNEKRYGVGLSYIIYLIFFLTILYLTYQEELNKILNAERKFEATLDSKEEELKALMLEVDEHKAVIDKTEERIRELHSDINLLKEPWKPIDLESYGITRREESIIKVLCLNTELSNKEIAAEIGVREGTIKQNFNRIYKKLGVANRQKMIEMCRRNFISDPLTALSGRISI